MAILTKDGKAVPFHGDHRPVSIGVGRKSRNLLPYPYYESNKTVSGVSFVDNGDGSVTANGTATETAYFNFVVKADPLSIGAGTYIVSCEGTYNSANAYVAIYSADGKNLGNSSSQRPFSVTDGQSIYVYIRVAQGATLDGKVFRPMLNEGSTALPYEPYGTVTDTIFKPANLKKSGNDVTFERSYNHTAELEVQGRSVQASFTGKNLLDGYVDSGNLWYVAVTYEDDPDTATGKRMKVPTLAADKNRLYIGRSQYPYDKLVAGKTYTVSLKVKASRDFGVSVFPFCEASGTRTTVAKPLNTEWQQISMTFEFLSGTQYAALYLIYPSWGGATFTENDAVYFADIQLEESTSATTYEPYVGGAPSPSPDYPQPIESIDSVKLVSRGRNLFSGDFVNQSKTGYNPRIENPFRESDIGKRSR